MLKQTLSLALTLLLAGAPLAARAQMPSAPLAAAAHVPSPPHVFVIVLENESYPNTFGPGSKAPYLANTLVSKGQLLTEYYGIGHNSNSNYLAMISGQAPNPDTQADCQIYSNFVGVAFAPNGQLVGQGCVFPNSVETVADQLQLHGYTWRGYMESMPAPCSHPALNSQDKTQTATATNEYATRHNPFVYFHTILDTPACAANDLPLTALEHDLASIRTTPDFSYIVPNLCHDGHDSPCADGEPGGLVSANTWLQQYVPLILNSPAFGKDGILIITFDEAGTSDSVACCNETPGPNSPLPGISGLGGGRVGAVLISPFVKPGTVNNTNYNHYSLLKTVEILFHLPFLGYAQPSDVPVFGSDVFNAKPQRNGKIEPRDQARNVSTP